MCAPNQEHESVDLVCQQCRKKWTAVLVMGPPPSLCVSCRYRHPLVAKEQGIVPDTRESRDETSLSDN